MNLLPVCDWAPPSYTLDGHGSLVRPTPIRLAIIHRKGYG
jgi:hypothetical protein